jgi:hypothetical protein
MERKQPNVYASTVPADRSAAGARVRTHGQIRDILLSFTLMTVPMLIFSALLLGLIFHYQVSQNAFVHPNLHFASEADDQKGVLVALSATTLTTIASWSSTLAQILVGCAVTLISFSVAREVLLAGANNQVRELLTPWQMSLMIRMMANGTPTSVWQWINHSLAQRAPRKANWDCSQVCCVFTNSPQAPTINVNFVTCMRYRDLRC